MGRRSGGGQRPAASIFPTRWLQVLQVVKLLVARGLTIAGLRV